MSGATTRRWLVVETEPCDYCAIWIGPHRHLLRDDGTLGIIVEWLPEQKP